MNIQRLIKTTHPAILVKIANSIDGHTIYKPEKFTDLGLHPDIVKYFTKNFNSGSNHKDTIYNENNQSINVQNGVYGLDLLECICANLGVSSWKMGRGSRASHLAEQLIDKLQYTL